MVWFPDMRENIAEVFFMKLKSFITTFLAAAVIVLSANGVFTSADGIVCSAEKKRAPDFVVTDADGNAVTLSQFFGKPIVLNFWATWCMPCVYELPDFEETFLEYGDRVVFMMINQTNGYSDTFQGVKDYAEICGFTFPLYFDTESSATEQYGASILPLTVLIDSDGNIHMSYIGILGGDELKEHIKKLL